MPCQLDLQIGCSPFPALREILTGTMSSTPVVLPLLSKQHGKRGLGTDHVLWRPDFAYLSETTREKPKVICKKVTEHLIYRKFGVATMGQSKKAR